MLKELKELASNTVGSVYNNGRVLARSFFEPNDSFRSRFGTEATDRTRLHIVLGLIGTGIVLKDQKIFAQTVPAQTTQNLQTLSAITAYRSSSLTKIESVRDNFCNLILPSLPKNIKAQIFKDEDDRYVLGLVGATSTEENLNIIQKIKIIDKDYKQELRESPLTDLKVCLNTVLSSDTSFERLFDRYKELVKDKNSPVSDRIAIEKSKEGRYAIIFRAYQTEGQKSQWIQDNKEWLIANSLVPQGIVDSYSNPVVPLEFAVGLKRLLFIQQDRDSLIDEIAKETSVDKDEDVLSTRLQGLIDQNLPLQQRQWMAYDKRFEPLIRTTSTSKPTSSAPIPVQETAEKLSIYSYDLKSKKVLYAVNADEPMQAASTIKSYVALVFMHQVSLGKIECKEEHFIKLQQMLQKSNNAATDFLMKEIALSEGKVATSEIEIASTVNQILHKNYGKLFSRTVICQMINLNGGAVYLNKTSTRNLTRVEIGISNKLFPYSELISYYMKKQPSLVRLNPEGDGLSLVEDVVNKTGTTTRAYADSAGIYATDVLGEEKSYTISAMIEGNPYRRIPLGSWQARNLPFFENIAYFINGFMLKKAVPAN